MHRSAAISALLSALILSASISAADDSLARVVNPPKKVEDSRIGNPHHVDNPASFTANFATLADWEKRAQDLRQQTLIANGLWPMPEKTPLNPVVHGMIDRDDYTIQKVYFASLPGHYVCGNLYKPKGRTGKLPAVLCPHGHWSNGRLYERGEAEAKKEIESGAEKTMESARYPLQARCAMLARMGCVVFFYDMVGYADSKQIPHTQGFSDAEADLRLQSFMGLQTWNSIRALDFLTSLPEVDPRRVAVTGASGGGTQTFILCAIDPRPAVSFPAVMVSTAMQGGCICENCSLLRIGTNNIELAALFAPKPQAMTGANDWTREIETKGLPDLKKVYGLYDAADRVMAKYAPFPHNYNQVSRELMYNWVNKHLQLGLPEPVVEKPFTPVPPKELSVFDAEHPLPKDATDARGTRAYMTSASDKQLAELAKHPEKHREILRAALRGIVVDNGKARNPIEPTAFSEVKKPGFTIHKTLLSRKDTGEKVPALGIIPAGWDKTTLVVWAHPRGKASLFGEDGQPTPLVRKLLDRKVAVTAPDLFMTGEYFLPNETPPQPKLDQKYHKGVPFAGYTYGYNRSVCGNRIHDMLTVLDMVEITGAKDVRLVAFGKVGPCALPALALRPGKVSKAVVDLNDFDVDQVKDPADEMMLPGALKYGGVYGFASLCHTGQTVLCNAPQNARKGSVSQVKEVTIKEGKATPEQMVAWVLE